MAVDVSGCGEFLPGVPKSIIVLGRPTEIVPLMNRLPQTRKRSKSDG